MGLADFPELKKLPKHQKLRLAEELWFSGIEDRVPVRVEHKALLDKRWKAYRTGKVSRISLAELERRLAR